MFLLGLIAFIGFGILGINLYEKEAEMTIEIENYENKGIPSDQIEFFKEIEITFDEFKYFRGARSPDEYYAYYIGDDEIIEGHELYRVSIMSSEMNDSKFYGTKTAKIYKSTSALLYDTYFIYFEGNAYLVKINSL